MGAFVEECARRLQTLGDSLAGQGGGDVHGHSTISVPQVSRPWTPYPTAARPGEQALPRLDYPRRSGQSAPRERSRENGY
eukprot:7023581-Pyramimonas_sp.AAC.1